MKLTDFLQDVGRPVAYFPKLKRITGSTTATILLCQFIYWRGKESDGDGWLYKTSEEIEDETGLTYNEQKTARKALVEAGLVQEHYARLDHQLRFKIDLDKINESWGIEPPKNGESDDSTLGNDASPFSLNSNTENTQESTPQGEKENSMHTPLGADEIAFELYKSLKGEKGMYLSFENFKKIVKKKLNEIDETDDYESSSGEEQKPAKTQTPKKKEDKVNIDIKTLARSRGVSESEIEFIDRACKAFGFSIMQLDEVSLVTYRWIAEQESKGQTIEQFADWARLDEMGKFIGKYRNSAGAIRNDWARAFGIRPPDDRTSLIRRMT